MHKGLFHAGKLRSNAILRSLLLFVTDCGNRRVSTRLARRVPAALPDFHVSVAELKAANKTRAGVIPRQVAIYLAKQMTEAFLLEIGREIGEHHTTVMNSIARIFELRRTDASINKAIETLFETLTRAT